MLPLTSLSSQKTFDHHRFSDLSNRIAANREKLIKLSEKYEVEVAKDSNFLNSPNSTIASSSNSIDSSFDKILNNLDNIVDELSLLHESYGDSQTFNPSSSFVDHSSNDTSFTDQGLTHSSSGNQDNDYWSDYSPSDYSVPSKSSLISSNYWMFGYSRVNQDFQEHQWSSNQLSFYGTSNINNYFTGYGSFFIGKGDYIDAQGNDFVDLLNWEYGFSGGVQLHFDLISGRLKPFIGADLGFEYSFAKAIASIDSDSISFGWGFIWGINLGTEVKIGDRFSIVPQLRIQDVEPTTIYGIDLAYFFSESWALNSGFMLGGDYSKFDFSVLFTY
jgi:hypothetical protein